MENVFNILKWDSDKNLQLLHQPVDKEKWTTEPAVVNAFYNPNKNDIGKFYLKLKLKQIYLHLLFYSISCGDIPTTIL